MFGRRTGNTRNPRWTGTGLGVFLHEGMPMTLEELTTRAERAVFIAAQLKEIDKIKPSIMDRIRWFNGGGNIDDNLQANMIGQGYAIVRDALRSELESLLGEEKKQDARS